MFELRTWAPAIEYIIDIYKFPYIIIIIIGDDVWGPRLLLLVHTHDRSVLVYRSSVRREDSLPIAGATRPTPAPLPHPATQTEGEIKYDSSLVGHK